MRLVTPYERRNLVLRTAVMEKLRLGKSYRQIAEELWLSSQTISVIKKATKETSYRSYYDRGKTERKKKVYSHRKPPPDLKKLYGPSVRTKYGVMYPP
ncbi:MAG: hypothetical protein HYS89_02125 [Candidatus Colwellbacteria bacterium]|nr:hypothetical protein [Candidatus Colwellbacteria bacterium]